MANDNEQFLHLVSFDIGGEMFALSIMDIQEIIRLPEIVSIPQSPDFVAGVINLRGKVLPVVDLKKRFALASDARDTHARIIIVEWGAVVCGFIVDRVHEVLRVDKSAFEDTPTVATGKNAHFVRGVVKHHHEMLMVLDISHIFSSTEQEVLQSVK